MALPENLFENISTPELHPPLDAVQDGFQEIARIWERHDPETSKRQIACSIRTAFPTLIQWGQVILTVTRAVIEDLNVGRPPLKRSDIDEACLNFLADVAEIISPTPEEPEEEAAEIAASPLPDHPGFLPIAPEVLQDQAWVQIFSIWHQPEVESCPDCGQDHDEKTLLTGNSKMLGADKIGRLLGSMATAHAGGTTATEGDRLKVLTKVQKGFNDYLSEGLPRA